MIVKAEEAYSPPKDASLRECGWNSSVSVCWSARRWWVESGDDDFRFLYDSAVWFASNAILIASRNTSSTCISQTATQAAVATFRVE